MTMRNSFKKWTILLAGVSVLAVTAAAQDKAPAVNPRPGQPGHRSHVEWQGSYPTPDSIRKFKFNRSVPMPEGFIGNLAFDAESGRLWLVSLGPPTNTKGPSTVYEVDPKDGKILAQATLPFKGDFGEPVFYNGYLYQGIFHESKVYKIVAGDRANLGKIEKTIALPTLIDLKLGDEAHSYPFIEFGGLTLTPDKNLMFHADDVGELITVERESGKLLSRSRTIKALGGIAGITGPNGEFLVLGNSDPRGGYCALSYPPSLSRSPEQKDISWALLDGKTGDVLASIRTQNSRAYASTVKIVKREDVAGSPYGKFTFLATGEDGIIELEWTPVKETY
jgi:hypothetical protein